MAIDGFMGSGKTPFGSMIEARLGRRCIRIDGYLPLTPPENQTRYIDRLDLGRLASDLTLSLNEGFAAIEGILAREALKRLGRSDETFHVYVAGAWVTGPGKVKWPDAAQLGSIQSSALHREIVRSWNITPLKHHMKGLTPLSCEIKTSPRRLALSLLPTVNCSQSLMRRGLGAR